MRSIRVILKAMLIVAYFAVTTVLLPSVLLRSTLLRGAERTVSDAAAVVVWGGFLVAGMVGLRLAQRRGWI
jgi:hypothetical protein